MTPTPDPGTGAGAVAVSFFFWSLIFIAYWVPTVVALTRRHPQKWAICAVNGLLGWTFLGWVGALVWSLVKPRQPQPYGYMPPPPGYAPGPPMPRNGG